MKFYESGDSSKPVIFLFPGTCCLYSSFDHVLDGLHSYFYTVTVSYDGFDPNEKTEFYSMEDECEKIEQEIRKKYDGRIKAAYGCSLGGSFVSLLIQRKRIHIEHGIIGSSDMDEAGNLVAKIQASMVVPFMYKMVHTGALPKFMQKKLNKTDGAKKELYNGFLICLESVKEEVRGLQNRVFIISSIRIWLQKSSMELMCREQLSTCFTLQRWVKNTKRDIVLISKIRTSEDITCSMKNCFAVIVQSGWKK